MLSNIPYFSEFMARGGNVLWLILAASMVLWMLILERIWFYRREYPLLKKNNLALWDAREDKSSWFAEQRRRQLISELDCSMLQNMKVIPGFIALMPMLGLMGTVTGMIQVFEVMAFMGSGNPRAMANGVSAATIPTMAGMIISLLAIPFSTWLDRRYRKELREVSEQMKTN